MRPSSFNRLGINSPRLAYEANANNINEDSIDCGIKLLRCCNTPRCQTFGTTTTFLSVLILVGIIQGTSEKFISITAQQAALEHGFDPDIVEWLLVTNGIAQGISAILIAYWGNRIHKISWFCGMLIFQSTVSLIVIIPTLSHTTAPQSTIESHIIDLICGNRTSEHIVEELPHSITTLIALFLLQAGIAYGFVAFYTLGLTYLDDNAIEHNAPALIGAALASKYWGYQWGHGISLLVHETSLGWWLGWLIISPTLLILAIIVGLFPLRMLETVVRQAAERIVDTAINNSQMSLARSKLLSDISFWSSFKRIVRNKILIINILATVFIETALVNYTLQEHNYLQSRFLLPADSSNLLNNEWTSRTITKFIQPLMVALAVLIGGLIIAKTKPSARKVVFWNVITAVIVCLLFVAYIFIDCKHNSVAGAYNGKLTIPFCSRNCLCDPDISFTPVCPENGVQTFFSPCHAGCSSERIVNDQRVFANCSCGIDTEISLNGDGVFATEGACGYFDCQKFWIIFQVLTVFGAICIGSRLVGKILISIRSVLSQDKALALATELTLVGIVAYIPGKIAYEAIADSFCQYWSHDQSICYLHDASKYGNYLNLLSALLCLIAAILEIVVFIVVKDLEFYGEETEADAIDYRPAIPLQNISNEQRQTDDTQAQPNEPLLPHLDVSPGIHTIQDTQTAYQPGATTTQVITSQTPSSSSSDTQRSVVPTKFILMNKLPQTHIDELNFRLQTLTENVESNNDPRAAFGSDINPSVGDASDKESELNIRHLESTVSSLSGAQSSSAVNSPEIIRDQIKHEAKYNFKRIETDF